MDQLFMILVNARGWVQASWYKLHWAWEFSVFFLFLFLNSFVHSHVTLMVCFKANFLLRTVKYLLSYICYIAAYFSRETHFWCGGGGGGVYYVKDNSQWKCMEKNRHHRLIQGFLRTLLPHPPFEIWEFALSVYWTQPPPPPPPPNSLLLLEKQFPCLLFAGLVVCHAQCMSCVVCGTALHSVKEVDEDDDEEVVTITEEFTIPANARQYYLSPKQVRRCAPFSFSTCCHYVCSVYTWTPHSQWCTNDLTSCSCPQILCCLQRTKVVPSHICCSRHQVLFCIVIIKWCTAYHHPPENRLQKLIFSVFESIVLKMISNSKGDFCNAHLPHTVEVQGALQ